MAPKAHHLNNVPLNWHKTIHRLFATAFGKSTSAYQHASLCGWRPLDPGAQLSPLLTDNELDDASWVAENGPGVVILETTDGITIEVDIPEIKEDSLYLEVSGDTLIIRGERINSTMPRQLNTVNQRNRSLFQRYIQLPVLAQPGQVRARLVGRVVRVNITKK